MATIAVRIHARWGGSDRVWEQIVAVNSTVLEGSSGWPRWR